MLSKKDPYSHPLWQKLQQAYAENATMHLIHYFEEDPKRFDNFSLRVGDLLLDYSKNHLLEENISDLGLLCQELGLPSAIKAMFTGLPINETENRPVLHTALRNRSNLPVLVDGEDVMPMVNKELQKIQAFCDSVHSGAKTGFSGKRIKHIVNIGIGGSDLGPHMVAEALRPYWKEGMQAHFVSNVDGTHLAETLKVVDAETTLFIIASKTFTTQETMTNAASARDWFVAKAASSDHVAKHFVAVSANTEAVSAFGILPENTFEMWDWVGGRFSLWSSIGLSIACTVGFAHFEELLVGAYSMDKHFREADFEENMPVLLALVGLWYSSFGGAETLGIMPYDQYLHRFPAFLQQLDMECNGKFVDRNGEYLPFNSGPIIWGQAGTNGQHAFFQLLHQGTHLVPCDFIAPAISHNPIGDHHVKLLANFFAQTESLMIGKTEEEAEQELKKQGLPAEDIRKLLPFKVFSGNRPSNTILLKQLTPHNLGALIALYEHKIFVQGILWNVFSFDQWGVELGKQQANELLVELKEGKGSANHDSSTTGLLQAWRDMVS